VKIIMLASTGGMSRVYARHRRGRTKYEKNVIITIIIIITVIAIVLVNN